jgi:transposase
MLIYGIIGSNQDHRSYEMLVNTSSQKNFDMSNYSRLYDILISKDNFYRLLNENVDFSFVYDFLKDKYSSTTGRTAQDVIRMFRFLILKSDYELSDRGLIKRTKTDMEFKFFLGYMPEETQFIDPSLLTKFRKERLGDDAQKLLDELLAQTVKIALKSGVMKNKVNLITDATHTRAMYGKLSPREALINIAKKARKTAYTIDVSAHDRMPKKRESTGLLEDQIEYTKELIEVLTTDEVLKGNHLLEESIDSLNEMIEDINEHMSYSKDEDAKIGHKSADTSFFGYKSNLAMSEEGIIVAATISTGETYDGDYLPELIEKAQSIEGIQVVAVTGDAAYSEKDNIEYCEGSEILLASKLSKNVTDTNEKNSSSFRYNKDADMYVCKQGHMAIRKANGGSSKGKYDTKVVTYFFDTENCRICPHKEGCYKDGAKSKSFSVKKKQRAHLGQEAFMQTEAYQRLYSHRYKIEQKNAELKNRYNYENAQGVGLGCMASQACATLFVVNMKKIFRLSNKKA